MPCRALYQVCSFREGSFGALAQDFNGSSGGSEAPSSFDPNAHIPPVLYSKLLGKKIGFSVSCQIPPYEPGI